ncbi:uncharacterized protein [Apostichopus japonicus]
MADTSKEQKKAFRTVLVDVGKTLTEKHIKSLAFEYGITRADADKISEGWELFDMMSQDLSIDPQNVDPLLDLLEKRNLNQGSDLLKKYKDKYQKGAAKTESRTSTPPSDRKSDKPNQGNGANNIVDDDIISKLSKSLTREWRDVGRGLKITEAEMQDLTIDVRSGQRETIYQMLILWKRKHGDDATYGALIKALTNAGRKDLSDDIQKHCEISQE